MVQNEVYPVFFWKMGELKDNHEVMKLELENSHAEQLQSVKQQYEMSLEGEWTVFMKPDPFSDAEFYKIIWNATNSSWESFGCILT